MRRQVLRLFETAEDLRHHVGHPVTRLTSIKSLCRTQDDATAFTAYLAQKSFTQMRTAMRGSAHAKRGEASQLLAERKSRKR